MKCTIKNKKIYLLSFVIILSIFIFSCRKINILSPNIIPPPTDFRIPNKLKPIEISVEENKYSDTLVFGGFRKKFFFRGKWYVLAEHSYKYDIVNKKLKINSTTLILEITENAEIKIVAQNLGHNAESAWSYLNLANVINDNEIIYEPYNYGYYSLSKSSYQYMDNYLNKDVKIEYYDKVIYTDLYYRSTDMLTWAKHGRYDNLYMYLPKPTQLDNSKDTSWQGRFGVSEAKMALVDDYIYVYGLEEMFYEQNPDGIRYFNQPDYYLSKNKYYRIHRSKDMSDANNWEDLGETPWGYYSGLQLRTNENGKIFIGNGGQITLKQENKTWVEKYSPNTWVNENFIDWYTLDKSEFEKNEFTSTDFYGDFGLVKKREKTPTPPKWVKSDNNVYYKTYNDYIIDAGMVKYYIPIPPVNEIKEAFNRGEKTFTIKPEHLKNAGKNIFMVTDKDPNTAKEEDWTLLTPVNYDENSMVWQFGKDDMLFNANGKIIQLVDYSNIIARTTLQQSAVNELMYQYRNYYSMGDYYNAMYCKAQADMLNMMMSNPDYLMPDDAISHYTIEFRFY